MVGNNIQSIIGISSIDGCPVNQVFLFDSDAAEILTFFQDGDIHRGGLVAVNIVAAFGNDGFHVKHDAVNRGILNSAENLHFCTRSPEISVVPGSYTERLPVVVLLDGDGGGELEFRQTCLVNDVID